MNSLIFQHFTVLPNRDGCRMTGRNRPMTLRPSWMRLSVIFRRPKIISGTPQMLISNLDYSNYLGRIAIGRLHRGELTEGMNVSLVKRDGTIFRTRIKELSVYEGLAFKKTPLVTCGDICALVGIEGFNIGDTIAEYEDPEALDSITVDEPTMSMLFTINDSPFYGKDGKYVTSRHLKDRLGKRT